MCLKAGDNVGLTVAGSLSIIHLTSCLGTKWAVKSDHLHDVPSLWGLRWPGCDPDQGVKSRMFPTTSLHWNHAALNFYSECVHVEKRARERETPDSTVGVRDMAGALGPRWKQDFMENLFLVKGDFLFSITFFFPPSNAFWQAMKQLCRGLPKPVNSCRKHACFSTITCMPCHCMIGILDILMNLLGLWVISQVHF